MEKYEKTIITCKAFPYIQPWLKLKDAPKRKYMQEPNSSSSKRSRNVGRSTCLQQSDDRKHIDINDESVDVKYKQPLRRPIWRNKGKKVASYSSSKNLGSNVIDHFGGKFDRYVQQQEHKVAMMSRVEH